MNWRSTFFYYAVAVVLSVITYYLFSLRYQEAPPLFLYISFFLFATLSSVSHNFIGKVSQSKSGEFVQRYMGLTAIKMFLILSVLTIYLWFNKEHLFAVGLIYAGAYILFLIIDTGSLLKQLNTKK